MGYIWGLLAISAAVVSTVIALTLPHWGAPGRAELFARFSVAAGIAAVGSSLMYAIYELSGGVLALVVGDAFMVLGPGAMLLAMGALTGHLRAAVITVSVAVVLVSVTTTVTDTRTSLLVKIAVLCVLCLGVAGQTRRAALTGFAGTTTLLVVNLGYATFCAGRIVAALTVGWESPLYRAVFSIVPTTAVGAIAVVATGLAVWQVLRSQGWSLRRRSDAPAEELVVEVAGWRVSLTDPADVRRAFGADTVSEIARDLETVGGALRRRAETTEVSFASSGELAAHLRLELEARGWSPTEIALLTVEPAVHPEEGASGAFRDSGQTDSGHGAD